MTESAQSPLDVQRQRMLASLAPLLSFAGIFAHPVATTILPFLLFLFVRNRNQPLARDSALRTADFAFSMSLWLLILGFAVSALEHISVTAPMVPPQTRTLIVALVLLCFVVLVATALVQGLRGRDFRYPLSFRFAERVFAALEKRAAGGG